jgi:hypothetical protein
MGGHEMVELEISKKLKISFPVTRVGYISAYVEPINLYYGLVEARRIFDRDPEITSIPVEREGGVVGLVTRGSIVKKSNSFWERIKGDSLGKYQEPYTQIYDAQENAEKVLQTILSSQDRGSFLSDYLIYHNGRYRG